MSKKQLVGLVGSILIIVGVFLPIASISIFGSIKFFDATGGKVVLALGLASLALTFMKKYVGLWATGLLSLGLTVLNLINTQSDLASMSGPSGAGGSQLNVSDLVTTEWLGWIVLIAGSVAVILAAALKEQAAPGQPQSFQRGA
jgi:hypothetical protein